ncbi:MAG: hypothetical protein V3U76_04450 [Granulosicoccus sp.]
MLQMPKKLGNTYSPLYFLSSLGAGGLVITFFMYLMFWVPHTGLPVPVFENIADVAINGALVSRLMVWAALAGIAFFSLLHFRMLFWNLSELRHYRETDAWKKLHASNAATQCKAVPLTLAMSVNVLFMLGLVFVPQLWSVVEYLFPFALVAFVLIGAYALKLLGVFFGRVFTEGGFDLKANNSFAQLLPAFALAMVSVGLAAPAAMSTSALIVGIAAPLSIFFMTAAVVVGIVAMVIGFHSMIEHGTSPEAAPTLMVVIPILTVLGIAMVRLDHGLHAQFDVHSSAGNTFVMLSTILSVQLLFGMLGILVMRRQSYFTKYLTGSGQRSAGSYALVCPGVALSVMLHFFVNAGLVATGLLTKFSVAYWVAMSPAIALQLLTIMLVFYLQRLHFGQRRSHDVPVAV